jgi:antitoxin (DNA-binding transcriptional repressor) of toxin-antitoxin stability system
MRAVDLRVLKAKLREYILLAAAGETVLITIRGRVVAEIVQSRGGRARVPAEAMLADAVRRGWITPPLLTSGTLPPRRPVMSFDDLMSGLAADRGA